MTHNSRSRTLATSNCGRLQVQRDDPFTLKDANFGFYNDLVEKMNPQFEQFKVCCALLNHHSNIL